MSKLFQSLLDNECDVLTNIYTTRKYDLFGFIRGNRNTDSSHIRKIRQSLRTKQILEVALVVVPNPDLSDGRPPFFIVDGQHRFKSIVEENLPVSFVIAESINFDDNREVLNAIELLNTANSEWDINGFLTSKSALGNDNYLRYGEIYDNFSFEHEIIFFLIKKLGGVIDHNKFKKGLLEFDLEMSNNVYNILTWLNQYVPIVDKYGKRYYLKALIELRLMKGVDISRLDNVILKNENKFNPDFLDLSASVFKSLEYLIYAIYNKGLRKDKIGITKYNSEGTKYKLQMETE